MFKCGKKKKKNPEDWKTEPPPAQQQVDHQFTLESISSFEMNCHLQNRREQVAAAETRRCDQDGRFLTFLAAFELQFVLGQILTSCEVPDACRDQAGQKTNQHALHVDHE